MYTDTKISDSEHFMEKDLDNYNLLASILVLAFSDLIINDKSPFKITLI